MTLEYGASVLVPRSVPCALKISNLYVSTKSKSRLYFVNQEKSMFWERNRNDSSIGGLDIQEEKDHARSRRRKQVRRSEREAGPSQLP